MQTERIAVLIPCLNEEQTIGKVVRDFKAQLPQAEIYVYDNNSTDGTAAAAAAAGAIVRTEYRRGKGNVVRSMFEDVDADIYVLVDGDDTYPAEDVGKLIQPVREGRADMVAGDRLSASYFTENKRPMHNSGNRVVRWLVNRLFARDLKDIMTGYRAFSRNLVKNFPVMSNGFEIETEMTIFTLEHNFKVAEQPVNYRDRPRGSQSKLNTLRDGTRVLRTIAMLFRDYRPLMFFTVTALLTGLVGLGLFIPVLIEYWHTGLVPRFPTLIVACFLMLAGMLLFIAGMILDVIKRTTTAPTPSSNCINHNRAEKITRGSAFFLNFAL